MVGPVPLVGGLVGGAAIYDVERLGVSGQTPRHEMAGGRSRDKAADRFGCPGQLRPHLQSESAYYDYRSIFRGGHSRRYLLSFQAFCGGCGALGRDER